MTQCPAMVNYTKKEAAFMIQGNLIHVNGTHPHWNEIIQAHRDSNYEKVLELANMSKGIKQYVEESLNPRLEVDDVAGTIRFVTTIGAMKLRSEPLHNVVVDRILQMRQEGYPVGPLVNFLSNLLDNPSQRAVEELYKFLEYGKMPITSDGHFLAYKRVNNDYTSVHDGVTDNSIGKIVEMKRELVNDDSNVTCSTGLHFCSFDYLKHFSGSRVVIVKVNPKDVVSIPKDYNDTKGRACKYLVVSELSPEQLKAAEPISEFSKPVYDPVPVELTPTPEPVLTSDTVVNPTYKPDERNVDSTGARFVKVAGATDTWMISPWYVQGYNKGYADGKGKSPRAISLDNTMLIVKSNEWTDAQIEDINIGYEHGYKDGKGHKTKAYK